MTPADRLRAAATRLQEMAGAATPGPWVADIRHDGRAWVRMGMGGLEDFSTHGYPSDGAYVAMMHPPVAFALAKMLEGDAEAVDGIEDRFFGDGWMKTVLAVADAVLGDEILSDEILGER